MHSCASRNNKPRSRRGLALISELCGDTGNHSLGAGTRNRTRDLLITSQLLYLLSYTGGEGRPL